MIKIKRLLAIISFVLFLVACALDFYKVFFVEPPNYQAMHAYAAFAFQCMLLSKFTDILSRNE